MSIETVHSVRTARTQDSELMLMLGCGEDKKIVIDFPPEQVEFLFEKLRRDFPEQFNR